MTAENVNHVQVSCCPKFIIVMSQSAFYNKYSKSLNVVEIIDILRSFLVKEITQKCALDMLKVHL